jgi:hypothetical protein
LRPLFQSPSPCRTNTGPDISGNVLANLQMTDILLARNLMDAISAGKFPVGGLMPTEHDVALRYSVNRATEAHGYRLFGGIKRTDLTWSIKTDNVGLSFVFNEV